MKNQNLLERYRKEFLLELDNFPEIKKELEQKTFIFDCNRKFEKEVFLPLMKKITNSNVFEFEENEMNSFFQMVFNTYDFNNIQKNLSLNLYFSKDKDVFSFKELEILNKEIVEKLNCNIISTSGKDFEPQGSSLVCFLENKLVSHLDKSHLSFHTYFTKQEIRVDLMISTCGNIIPLNILKFIIEKLKPITLEIDYFERGRDENTSPKFYKSLKDFLPNNLKVIEEKFSESMNFTNVFIVV